MEEEDSDDEKHANEKKQELDEKETKVPIITPIIEPNQREKKKKKKLDKPKKENEELKLDVDVSIAENSQKKKQENKHSKKIKPKKKNKNILESITDERLLAYGIEPKKFHKKIKYSNKIQK